MDKRPPTTYIDYLRAAEVHIAACKELRRRLRVRHDLYRNLTDRNKVKQEIYYLSGYVIECMVCYAVGDVLDRLNPDENVHQENILSIDKILNTPKGKKPITFNPLFKEAEHKITNKLKFIKEYRQNNRRSDIPILDNSNLHKDDGLNRTFKFLHERWLPHVRYKLSDEVKKILYDNDDLLYNYIEFMIEFANKIRREFNFRTKKRRK